MEMTTAKTIAVFAIIFGCFAVLYPKIFHPMVLHVVGLGGKDDHHDNILNRVPPHLKKGHGASRPVPGGDDISKHIRAGPHPGLRAAAEMKKQAAAQQGGGGGKGMMGIVLPMYAVGIVIYLVYTMSKVFGKKDKEEKGDYLNSHFSDLRYDPSKKQFVKGKNKDSEDEHDSDEEDEGGDRLFKQTKKQRRDLERLLLKADKNNISEMEMTDLKSRLQETESQMTRILQAMELVQQKVATESRGGKKVLHEEVEDEPLEEGEDGYDEEDMENIEVDSEPNRASSDKVCSKVDSSPDTESYEIINGQSSGGSAVESPSIEDIGVLPSEDTTDTVSSHQPEEDTGEDADDTCNTKDCGEEEDYFNEGDDIVLSGKQDSDIDQQHPDLRKRAKKN